LKTKQPRARWEWDRRTIALVLFIFALVALVAIEVIRSGRPVGP
jgi:hypothetical protein